MPIDVDTLPPPNQLRSVNVDELPSPSELQPGMVKGFAVRPTPDKKAASQLAAEQTLAETPASQRFLVGVGKGLNDLGVGVQQRLLQAGAALGVPDADRAEKHLQQIIDDEKAATEPLTHTLAGGAGQLVGTAVPGLLSLAVPGSSTLLGAAGTGAVLGAAEATGSDESVSGNAAAGALGGFAGQVAGKFLGAGAKYLLERVQARRAAREVARQIQKASLNNAQDLGLAVPPSLVTEGAGIGKTIQGLAGSPKTIQEAAAGNQPRMQAVVRRAFGIPEGVPLRDGVLDVRRAAGEAYDDLRSYPEPIVSTFKYANDINNLTQEAKTMARFPELAKNDDVEKLQFTLLKPDFSANEAVTLIKRLREAGATHDRSGEDAFRELGKFQRGAAGALEDLVDQNLQQARVPGLLDDFRNARKTIAQTYDIEDALLADGNTIDATKLAAKLKAGKKLSGDIKALAEFGGDFPSVGGVPPRQGTTPFTAIDALAGIAGAVHNPALVAAVLARPAARAALLSKLGQRALLPGDESAPGLITKALSGLQQAAPAAAPTTAAGQSINGGLQNIDLPALEIHGDQPPAGQP